MNDYVTVTTTGNVLDGRLVFSEFGQASEYTVNKVQNGYILKYSGYQYVFETLAKMHQWLDEKYNPKPVKTKKKKAKH